MTELWVARNGDWLRERDDEIELDYIRGVLASSPFSLTAMLTGAGVTTGHFDFLH